MSEETKQTETSNEATDSKVDKGTVVPRETYEKLLKEKKNSMAAIDQLRGQVEALQNVVKEKEESVLKTKEDWKTLYEQKEKELIDYKTKWEVSEKEKLNGYKLSAARKEFEKMGADTKSMDFLLRSINLEALKYDSDHKVVLGAEDEAKRVKEYIPAVFGKQSAGASHSAPDLEHKKLTIEDFKKMSLADKKKHQAELYKSLGVNIKP